MAGQYQIDILCTHHIHSALAYDQPSSHSYYDRIHVIGK